LVLNLRVIPKASRNFVKKEAGSLKVYLTKPPADGLANEQLIEILSDYLGLKKYQIKILRGEKSRNKCVEIPDGTSIP